MASPLLLVGCGKMGGAMLDGWLAGGMADAGVEVFGYGASQDLLFSAVWYFFAVFGDCIRYGIFRVMQCVIA